MNHQILKKFNLTQEEESFLKESNNPEIALMNYSKIISSLYLAKTLEESTKNTIESNTKLSKSNDTHSKRMLQLTGGLIFVGIADIIVQLVVKYL